MLQIKTASSPYSAGTIYGCEADRKRSREGALGGRMRNRNKNSIKPVQCRNDLWLRSRQKTFERRGIGRADAELY